MSRQREQEGGASEDLSEEAPQLQAATAVDAISKEQTGDLTQVVCRMLARSPRSIQGCRAYFWDTPRVEKSKVFGGA